LDIKALINNIVQSIKTTPDLKNGIKKLRWLYNRSNSSETVISFNYPKPVGKINLLVRDNGGADVFIASEVFDKQCYNLLLKQVANILDLGANAGFTGVYFSKLFPNATIACVEPMPGNIAVLKKNLLLNNVNHIIFEAAATVNDGRITMSVADKDYGSKVHNIALGKNTGNNTTEVEGLSITTILNTLNWQKVDILKIDIEGYEGLLLASNNDWLHNISIIIMEIHEGVTIDFIKDTTAPFGFGYVAPYLGNWILSKDQIL
jgi:FkbM family methyltransferase